MTTHTDTDLTIEIPVAAPASALRAAVGRVEDWWTTTVDRSGNEFTARFGDNWTTIRDEGDRWIVTAQDTPAIPVADEWVGDTLTFDALDTGDGTSLLRFTHEGLLAQQCAADCQAGWQRYLPSLVALAETGKGDPRRPDAA